MVDTNIKNNVLEILKEGTLSFPTDRDIEVTELGDEITVYCGSALDVADRIPRGDYKSLPVPLKAVMDAYLYIGNYGLASFMDNTRTNDKAIIKNNCPTFYQAAKNVREIEVAGFEPHAILGDTSDNSYDATNKAIKMMDEAWEENRNAENGELGDKVQEAMSGTYDSLLSESNDFQYVCQIKVDFIEKENGDTEIIVSAGNPLHDLWTRLYSLVVEKGTPEEKIKTGLIDIAYATNNGWLV